MNFISISLLLCTHSSLFFIGTYIHRCFLGWMFIQQNPLFDIGTDVKAFGSYFYLPGFSNQGPAGNYSTDNPRFFVQLHLTLKMTRGTKLLVIERWLLYEVLTL